MLCGHMMQQVFAIMQRGKGAPLKNKTMTKSECSWYSALIHLLNNYQLLPTKLAVALLQQCTYIQYLHKSAEHN